MRSLLAVTLALTVPAVAFAAHPTGAHKRSYEHARADLVRAAGHRAPGRDVVRHGLSTGKPVTDALLRKLTAQLERMSAPAPVVTQAVTPASQTRAYSAPRPPAATTGGSSGGGGGYCGLYQFDQQTWNSVGGSGSPCAASPSEQRSRAQTLQSQRGNSPWPVCGRGGASLDQIARCESGNDPHARG